MRSPKEVNFPELLNQYLEKYFSQHSRDNLPCDLHKKMISTLEKALLSQVLKLTNQNQVQAAKLLGVNRNTLRNKLLKLGINFAKKP